MVKADVKHNYYADLELPTTATIDDVRKAYRKMALQYHPDRNAGREEECVPRFQAIQAANEILSDPATKQKYDNDRRKAGFYSSASPYNAQTFNPRQPAPGNPYAANTNFAPPPRRTAQPNYGRPTPQSGPQAAFSGPPPPTGADRFTPFMRAAPTAKKDSAFPARPTQTHTAWQAMNQSRAQAQQPQAGQSQQPRQRPPPPPRPDSKMPTEEQIRNGTRYHNASRFDPDGLDRNAAAWREYRQQAPNAAQANAAKPAFGRTNSFKTPSKHGFNPNNVNGSDEKAPPASRMHRNRSADFGRPPPAAEFRAPPPPSGTGPTTPQSPLSPTNSRQSATTPNDQVPFFEGNRVRTPYSSFIHEKLDLGGGLRRSYSVRDASKLGPEDAANRGRARSTSPLGRQPKDDVANGKNQKKPFVVYSDSEASDDGMTQTPNEMNDPGTNRPTSAPNAQPPPQRPIRVPNPPSRRAQAGTSTTDGTQSDAEQPSMQQRTSPNMYENPISSSSPYSSAQPNSFGSRLRSTRSARRIWSRAGSWALPSSVNPSAQATKSSAVQPAQTSVEKAFVTAADLVFQNARPDERNAYLQFQADLRQEYEQVPDNLDMEVFLKLASTARKGISCGRAKLDNFLQRLFNDFPSVGLNPSLHADKEPSTHSFSFPRDEKMFESTANAKSRSEENINTTFSPEGWSGAFTGEPDYFAPPTSTSRKPPSPNRRPTRLSREQSRSATMDEPSTSTQREETPSRRWGSDATPMEVPVADKVRFNKEEWAQTFKDASWTFPPPPPRQSSPGREGSTPAARKASQARKLGKGSMPRQQPPQPSVEGEQGTADGGADVRPEGGFAQDDGDAMDIDDAPPVNPNADHPATPRAPATEKEARLYSVPPSAWRKSQAQAQQQTSQQRTTSGPSVQANDGAKLNTTLDDLRNVEPIAKPAPGSNGLNNLADLTSELPFQSRASDNLPRSHTLPLASELPKSPKPPPEPTRLSKASWKSYVQAFGDYCIEFHKFHRTMLRHFDTWENRCEERFMQGRSWLEAAGDTSGVGGNGVSGFGAYAAETYGMERTREYWGVGCERHAQGVRAFEMVRERVRRLAEGGLLPEV